MENRIRGIFDSHAHYDDERFDDDREELLGQMLESGKVCGIVHAATNLQSSRFGLTYAEKFPGFYTSVGIHPEETDCYGELPEIEALLRAETAQRKLVAVGEIGLDYHYEGYDRSAQIALFEAQLQLANTYGLPVIVHMRDATEDGMALLRKHHPRGVMHCFSGSAETAREVLALGMYISFTGVLTFKNAKKALRALEVIPPDKLLAETDCPYMAPEPYRGKRCDSTMIAQTLSVVAQRYGISVQEAADLTAQNARTLFFKQGRE